MNSNIERTIPHQMPTNGQDWFNYAARYGSSSCQLQAVLECDGHLDPARIKQAVNLTLEAEPVLGCRFVEEQSRPYWQRQTAEELSRCFEMEETTAPDPAVQQWLALPLDFDRAPQVLVKLIRTATNDILGIKLNHSCGDGGGLKSYLQLLADVYTRLGSDLNYQPLPNNAGQRDQQQLCASLGIENLASIWDSQANSPVATWAFPGHPGEPAEPHVALRRLSGERFTRLLAVARQKGVTVNDLILTAFYRALFAMVAPQYGEPMEIMVSVDLRRYLPNAQAGAICNLSGSVNARVERLAAETFAQTLSRVTAVMQKFKQKQPGLQIAAFFEMLGQMGFGEVLRILHGVREQAVAGGKYSPILTNIGVISQTPLHCGTCAVRDAYLVTPAIHAPGFMLGASSYNNVLTLAVSYYEPTTRQAEVEELLDLVSGELTFE